MSRIEYNPSLNDRVNGQLGDLGVEIQIPLSSIKALFTEPAPVAPYKVYTALVTQNGESEYLGVNTGDLTIGITYQIIENDGTGWDFTNVGAPNNNIGTWFVATGITPNSWGTNEGGDLGTLRYNVGAPVVTVLQNTIGNIWFEYNDPGNYIMTSNSLFTGNKTVSLNDQTRCIDSGNNTYNLKVTASSENAIYLETLDEDFAGRNGRLTSKPIEIRVYN
jgi:hypothetical protein